MTDLLDDNTRARMREFLPDAMAKALSSYHVFSQQDIPDEAKDFAAYHSACKTAIAHIDLLLKLGKQLSHEEPDKNDSQMLEALLNAAEQDLEAYINREKET